MTFTYTSADLAEIAASVPTRASEAGLVIVPGVEIARDADVRIDSHQSDIASAVKLATLVKAPFLNVTTEAFWAQRVRNTEGYEDLPPAAERLLKAAEKYDDSLMSVEVSWVADGLAYEWVAQSDWIGPLLIDIDAAVESAEAEADTADRENLTEYYANIKAATAVLAESRKYRGEQVGKRRHIMAAIIAEAGMDEIDDVTLSHRVMPEANRIVNARAYEFEQDFRARKAELAEELRNSPAWQAVFTKAERKAVATKFLTKKADGHRLSTDLAAEISDAAANPIYVPKY